MVKITYDSKIDSLYIDLAEGKYDSSKKITDAIIVDISKDDKVLGVEILDATENIKRFDPHKLQVNVELNAKHKAASI